jgi:EAL domain-containing protein (putative c-di-GMP-specific phosphodiesterase class I)
MPAWILRALLDGGNRIWHVAVTRLPFRIGRGQGLDLTLPGTSVSTQHAELYESGGRLRVRDLGSTNGTYVNRQRVEDAAVGDGDVLHFADFEFCLEAAAAPRETTAVIQDLRLPELFGRGTRELHELIQSRQVSILYQVIVALSDGHPVTYEALGRGAHPALPTSAQELFRIAENIGLAVSLSQLLRQRAVEIASGQLRVESLFLNTHPQEIGQPALVESLARLRAAFAGLRLVLEIHESSIASSDAMRDFRSRLRDVDIALAYDDFGAGQARLLELAEVPPEYLKFDSRFVRGIAAAPDSKQRVVRSLVSVCRDLGVRTVAEGVEDGEDAAACAQMGFELAQGFHFGRPQPIESL